VTFATFVGIFLIPVCYVLVQGLDEFRKKHAETVPVVAPRQRSTNKNRAARVNDKPWRGVAGNARKPEKTQFCWLGRTCGSCSKSPPESPVIGDVFPSNLGSFVRARTLFPGSER
jgi:hypothetical protein